MDEEAVEDLVIVWQDVLDEIAAGRPDNLRCPYCGRTPLKVETEGRRTRIGCDGCGKYIEGAFGGL
ncbi:hypothetical protein [Haliangium sp.]|uniref:hypothetical protein n=1 Tax=Haliangium sp. TaxID=2663208 RepID=UPI003D13EF16